MKQKAYVLEYNDGSAIKGVQGVFEEEAQAVEALHQLVNTTNQYLNIECEKGNLDRKYHIDYVPLPLTSEEKEEGYLAWYVGENGISLTLRCIALNQLFWPVIGVHQWTYEPYSL